MTLDLPKAPETTGTDSVVAPSIRIVERYYVPRVMQFIFQVWILAPIAIILILTQRIFSIFGFFFPVEKWVDDIKVEDPSIRSHPGQPNRTTTQNNGWLGSFRDIKSSLFGQIHKKQRGSMTGNTNLGTSTLNPLHPGSTSGSSNQLQCAFWCVRRDDEHEILKEVPMGSTITDGEFFETLRLSYFKLRGVQRFFTLNYICNIRYVSVSLSPYKHH